MDRCRARLFKQQERKHLTIFLSTMTGHYLAMKKTTTLLKTGIIGSVIAALCCFTPILVIILGVIGMSSIVGYLDYVLFPTLGVFVGITFYALMLKTKG